MELFRLSGMEQSEPLALERVVKTFADFVSGDLHVSDHVIVYHKCYRLQSDPGRSSGRIEFVFDLKKFEGKLWLVSQFRNPRFIKLRGGFVQKPGNSLQPASIVVVDGYGDTLLSIEGMTEFELLRNLRSNVGLFCSAPPTDSVPPSWINLLERLVLSVQSFPVHESNKVGTRTRQLLLGILYEFQLATK
jgi:hypothetical protein